MGARVATITNEVEFKAWLDHKPREVAVVLAARSALRVLPLIGTWLVAGSSADEIRDELMLGVFRAIVASLNNVKYVAHPSDRTLLRAANALAQRAIDRSASARIARTANASARSAHSAVAVATQPPGHEVAHIVIASLEYALVAVQPHAIGRTIWRSLAIDASLIDAGRSAQTIAELPIWEVGALPEGLHPLFQNSWSELRAELLALGHDWDVWTDWYDAILDGKLTEPAELAVFRASLNGETDWEKGPAYVNALIKEKMKQLEERLLASGAPYSVPFEVGFLQTEIASTSETKPKTTSTGDQKRKTPPPRAKSALGKIVIANAQSLTEQIDLLIEAIDLRREYLESHKPNDEDGYDVWKIEHDNILDLAARVHALEKSVRDFLACQGPEDAIEPAVASFSNSLKVWWNKHDQEVINAAWRFGKKAGKLGVIVASAGVGASFGMAFATTPVAIAVIGGDKLIEQVGKIKLPKGKVSPPINTPSRRRPPCRSAACRRSCP